MWSLIDSEWFVSWCTSRVNKWISSHHHCVTGLCPSSLILNARKQDVSEVGSASIIRWVEGDTNFVGSLRKSWPQSLAQGPTVQFIPLLSSPDDRNRSSFRNVVFSGWYKYLTMDKSWSPTILSVKRRRQDPLGSHHTYQLHFILGKYISLVMAKEVHWYI
jgi:hypothetical protein